MFGVFWCDFALYFCQSKGILENRQIEKNVIIWVGGRRQFQGRLLSQWLWWHDWILHLKEKGNEKRWHQYLNITPQRKRKRKNVTPIFEYYTSKKKEPKKGDTNYWNITPQRKRNQKKVTPIFEYYTSKKREPKKGDTNIWILHLKEKGNHVNIFSILARSIQALGSFNVTRLFLYFILLHSFCISVKGD